MPRLSLKRLALFSRQLGNMVGAGIPLRRALGTLRKTARGRVGRTIERIADDVSQGHSFSDAVNARGNDFPPLMQSLIHVGEETGSLDIVLDRLADYYEMQRNLMRRLVGRLILPCLQYLAAVLVVALATMVASMLPTGGNPFGVGLPPYAILALGWGLVPAAWLVYLFFTRYLGGARPIHELALRLPIVGHLMRTFAVGRFSWCMSLCTNSGMGVFDAAGMSLAATANAAFAGRSARVQQDLRGGCTLYEALTHAELFPVEFLEIVDVAEQSGSLTDSLERASRQYFEDAERGAQAMASAVGWLIWVLIAIFIIIMIFRVASGVFGGMYEAIDGI